MRKELEDRLCEKYSKIFAYSASDEDHVSLMAYGCDHGDGWFNILDSLCANIQHHIDWKSKKEEYKNMSVQEYDEEHQTRVVQVKEKFGGLRFYVNNSDDVVIGMISLAESLSLKTCEYCGNPGYPRRGPWIKTLCDACDDKKRK